MNRSFKPGQYAARHFPVPRRERITFFSNVLGFFVWGICLPASIALAFHFIQWIGNLVGPLLRSVL